MPSDELINEIVVNLPNFFGFVLAVIILYKVNVNLVGQNTRLIDAIIKRENCDDITPKD